MTTREFYLAALIEINKVEAPHFLLEDFNYLLRKAIYQTFNKFYNLCEVNQQADDALNAIKTTYTYKAQSDTEVLNLPDGVIDLSLNSDEFELPADYYHVLSVDVVFSPIPCKPNMFTARKLPNKLHGVFNNAYLKPSRQRPYYTIEGSKVKILHGEFGAVESVIFSYLCNIKYKDLTDIELESETDSSDEINLPQYMNYEVINQLTTLLLENASDARLGTQTQVNQSIQVV